MQPAESCPQGTAHGTPGGALQQLFMQPLGLSAYRLSMDLGVAPIAVSQILRGRRAISAAMAVRLGTYFGVDPSFWLALQAAHDLQAAARELAAAGLDGQPPVSRCAALKGRALVVRETASNGQRRWEVLMVTPQEAAQLEAGGNGQKPAPAKAKPKAAARNSTTAKAVNGGKTVKKGPAKGGRALAGARR